MKPQERFWIVKSHLFWKDYSDCFVENRLALGKSEAERQIEGDGIGPCEGGLGKGGKQWVCYTLWDNIDKAGDLGIRVEGREVSENVPTTQVVIAPYTELVNNGEMAGV